MNPESLPTGPTEINNTNRNFKGQMRTEEVLCFCRKHWVTILPYLVGFFIFWIFYFVYLLGFHKNLIIDLLGAGIYQVMIFSAVVVFTYLFHRFFIYIFNYYLQVMIVTNYRIVNLDKTVFLKDSRDAIDVPEIQDIRMKRTGILQTVFDYGELIIILSSTSEPRRLNHVPHPDYHFRKINKTKREYILSRQLAKQAVFERVADGIEGTKTQITPESIMQIPQE